MTEFQPGEKIVLKNNIRKVYIFLEENCDGKYLVADGKGVEFTFHPVLLEKYDAVKAFGL